MGLSRDRAGGFRPPAADRRYDARMDAPPCAECGRPATIEQPDGPRCADHATNRAALKARLHALGAATLSADPAKRDQALAEADAIEYRIGELEVGA